VIPSDSLTTVEVVSILDKVDNFDVHKWNLKRYLKEINLGIDQEGGTDNVNQDDESGSLNITRGGDDAKMGAEEESDANVMGEGLNDSIDKINIIYTEQGRLYNVKVSMKGKEYGLKKDDFQDLLGMLNIEDEIPFKMGNKDEDVLDYIVKQLQDQGIEAEWNDYMDVS